VLAIRTVVDPLVAIGIGLLFLDEQIANGPASIAAEVVGLVIMTAGVYALAHRSPQLAARLTTPTQMRPAPSPEHEDNSLHAKQATPTGLRISINFAPHMR
jgi:hypothetical protein